MTMSTSDVFDLLLREAGVTLYGVIKVADLDEYLLRYTTPEVVEQTKMGPLIHPSAVHGLPRRLSARVVAVGSAQEGPTGRQWTAWFGTTGVPSVIADRFAWRKAVDVCRLIVSGRNPLPEGWESLTFDDDWHDIHGGTVGRWATPWGEVQMKDDDDGRGYLTATTTARDGIAATWKEEGELNDWML